jgi:thioredoxin 1
MAEVAAVTRDNFEAEVLKAETAVLVDFWAPWCRPCLAMAPVIDKLYQEMSDKLKVVKLNVDEFPDIATKYGIQSIPTLVVFKSGQEASRLIGFLPEPELKKRLTSTVS